MIEDRVKHYWTLRAHDFGAVRRNELENQMSKRWLAEIRRSLPDRKPLDILDVGTGTGFFAVLLAQEGHRVQGIDLTPAMLEEAAALTRERRLDIVFRHMDAQSLSYDDESFDVVISRNLTWTLPNPEKAYQEWFRVLRPGGVLLNFDANYGQHIRSESTQNASVAADSPYGHVGVTCEMARENADITLSMNIARSDVGDETAGTDVAAMEAIALQAPLSAKRRPSWDLDVLRGLGVQAAADTEVWKQVWTREERINNASTPMFLVEAVKCG